MTDITCGVSLTKSAAAGRAPSINPNWARLPLFDRTGWTRVRFGDVVENVNETVRGPQAAGIERFIAMEHLEPGSLHIREWGTIADGITFTRRCRPGQVLFGKRRAYQRKVAVAEFDALVSGDIYVLAPKGDRLLLELLPFLCLSERFFQHAVGTSAGSLSPRTNWSSLASFEFDLPPLDQQRRLAEILWAVQEVVQSYGTLVAALAQARRAQIDELIPAPGTKSCKMPFLRLDEVAAMQNGRPFPSAEYQASGVRLIRPGNLAPDGTLDWSPGATACLPERHRTDNPGWLIGPGQVLINLTAQSLEDGFIGRACLTGEGDEGLLNQRIGRFVLKGGVLPRYLFRCLQTTRFRILVENRCEGSKIRHLYFRHFEDFALPKLPEDQQREVADALDAADRALGQTVAYTGQIAQLRGSLANAIMD